MFRFTSIIAPASLVLLLTACPGGGGGGGSSSILREDAPAAFAETWCGLQESCACELDSLDACVDESSQGFADALVEAEAAGLVYHGECMAEYLDGYEAIGCQTPTELSASGAPASSGPIACKVVTGVATEGQPCTPHFDALGDSCVQGLYCLAGVCAPLTSSTPKAVGEVCEPQVDACVDGSICTNSATDIETFTCKDLPGLGEPCTELPQCEPGSYCDMADGVCTEPVGEGAACTSWDMCRPGSTCDTDQGVCVPEQPFVCLLGSSPP